MGTPLVNGNNYPDYRVNNPWGFNTGAVGGITPATEVFTPGVESTPNTNLFSGKYSGINENLGVGSKIYYPQQAGVDRTGTTLGIG